MELRWLVVLVCACGSKPAQGPPNGVLHRVDAPDRLQITGKAVPLASQPTTEWLGLPMTGDIDVAVDLQHLDEPARARGSIRVTCAAGCALGDGKTTIPTKGNRAFPDGITFGQITFDRFDIALDVVNGKGSVRTFEVVSKDVVLQVTGGFELAKPIVESTVDLCIRFDATTALAAHDPTTHAALQVTGAPRAADGLFQIRLVGPVASAKRFGTACDGPAPAEPVEVPQRPTLGSAEPPSGVPAEGEGDAGSGAAGAGASLVAGLVKRQAGSKYVLDRARWEAVLANPAMLANGARIVPLMKDGNAHGFKVYAIRVGSLYERLGFANGDAIISIAGEPMADAARALEVYTKISRIADGVPVDVVIERGGQRVTQTYVLETAK